MYYLQYGNTPLHTASHAGNTEVVEKLLSTGASIEAKDTVSITHCTVNNYLIH